MHIDKEGLVERGALRRCYPRKEPMVGLEPTTPALRKPCSTIELHRRNVLQEKDLHRSCGSPVPGLHNHYVAILTAVSGFVKGPGRPKIPSSGRQIRHVADRSFSFRVSREVLSARKAAYFIDPADHSPPRASMSAASLALPVARLLARKSSRPMKETGASTYQRMNLHDLTHHDRSLAGNVAPPLHRRRPKGT